MATPRMVQWLSGCWLGTFMYMTKLVQSLTSQRRYVRVVYSGVYVLLRCVCAVPSRGVYIR